MLQLMRKRGFKRVLAGMENQDSPPKWPDWNRQQRALIETINNHLRKEGRVCRKHKGRYCIFDRLRRGAIVADHVDLEQFAREAGLWKP